MIGRWPPTPTEMGKERRCAVECQCLPLDKAYSMTQSAVSRPKRSKRQDLPAACQSETQRRSQVVDYVRRSHVSTVTPSDADQFPYCHRTTAHAEKPSKKPPLLITRHSPSFLYRRPTLWPRICLCRSLVSSSAYAFSWRPTLVPLTPPTIKNRLKLSKEECSKMLW